MRTTGGERILRITFATPRCRPWYANVTTRSFTISLLYISNVSYSCVVFKKEWEYLRTVERIYSRSPPRTSWVYFGRHWRPSIPDRYLAYNLTIWYPGVDLQKTTLEIETCKRWREYESTHMQKTTLEIETCKRWREYESTHMVSRSWSVKDNSIKTSLECHQWSNTGHTFKTTYGISLGRLTPSS